MPSCQAINCVNERGKCGKSFFEIPDPLKSSEKRKLCKLWIDHLRNDKLKIETFVWSKGRVVCEEHFEQDCFERNLMAESLGFKSGRLTLKPGAVPTLVKPGPGVADRQKERTSTKIFQEKRRKAQLRSSVTAFVNTKEKISNKRTLSESTDSKATKPKKFKSSTAVHPQQSDNISFENVPVHAEQHDKLPLLTIPEILPCGHPCEVCRKIKGDENVLVFDHSYSKSKAEVDTSSEIQHASSSETPAKKDKPIFISSTPLKTDFQKCAVEPIFTPVHILDESFVSLTQEDDPEDVDYSLSVDQVESDSDNFENDISTCYTEEQKLIKENKFIVFESAIDTLINKLKCNICECPVDPDDIVKDLSNGTVITITANCTSGHIVVKWSSQPFLGKMPVGNLLVSAATLFCGQTYSHISQFAEFCNLQYISHTTYNKIQRQYLMPVVQHTWSLLQEVELKKIKEQNRQIRLAGDGRCDSPGFSAKYCTYSLLDIETQRIITFVVVKVTETGSSSKMEVEGFRRCMTLLLDMGFRIEVLATDRHVQIRSIMKKEFPEVQHQFDVWHLCKSIKKKLTLKAKGKGCEDLNHWMKSICNHLWWCASNCGGDKDILEESWISIVNHTVDIHSFEGKFFKQCAHTPIEPEVSDTKKWLVKDSKAHKALKEVVLDKRLRKDIRQLNEFCHTGNLEVFHSLLLKYTPKRQEFDNDQMWTRTALAVIDHNLNQNRGQKVNKDGEKAYKLVCPKATGQWVAKPVFNNKNYQWVFAMIENVLVQKETMTLPVKERAQEGNIAPLPVPSKSALIQKHFSRFEKSS